MDFTDENYDDIVNLPHHVSAMHPHMSLHDRAGQFSPFAALVGYDAQISETARITNKKIEPDEDTKNRIDLCLQFLVENAADRPTVTVTYFLPDGRKSGGAYVSKNGNFKMIDESDHTVMFVDGTKIPIPDIFSLEGEILRVLRTEE